MPRSFKKPRSYQEIVKRGVDPLKFALAQEAKAHRRRPVRIGYKPKTGTLFAIRNKRMAIREAALRKSQVIIKYVKITDGTYNRYMVAPYSYRYRMTRVGRRKMFFAWDMQDRRIKGFVLRNIKNAIISDRKFKPKWPIEF